MDDAHRHANGKHLLLCARALGRTLTTRVYRPRRAEWGFPAGRGWWNHTSGEARRPAGQLSLLGRRAQWRRYDHAVPTVSKSPPSIWSREKARHPAESRPTPRAH